MATDTQFGTVYKEEDFLVTAIADLPEIDLQAVTGSTIAVVAGGADGRLRLDIAASNDDDVGALTFGAVNWTAGSGDLWMAARFFLSSVTDNKYFIGFGDTIASADETTFSATTDTVTIDTMTDAIGLLYDEDATTKQVWAVAGATDVVTVSQGLGTATKPAVDTAVEMGVWLSADRKSAQWFINGKEVHRVNGDSVLVGAVDLVPGVWAYEQASAFNLDIDIIASRKGRSTT